MMRAGVCSRCISVIGVAFVVGMLSTAGCGSGDPFSYVPVSGKVTYEDGTPIPVKDLMVKFMPQGNAINESTHPRPGVAMVDPKTGDFTEVTSHKPGDGLVKGKHKVTLADSANQPLPATVIPREYGSLANTPLEVDTNDLPFLLRVRKP